MIKDFDKWNVQKKKTQQRRGKFCNIGEVWWCRIGMNIGFEQDGGIGFNRPVLVVKTLSKKTCIILPLTTSQHEHKYRINLGIIDGKRSKVILSQIKTIDTRRCLSQICEIKRSDFLKIKKAIQEMFE